MAVFGNKIMVLAKKKSQNPWLEGLVAYYPFDGSTLDFSGNGNDGIVNAQYPILYDNSGVVNQRGFFPVDGTFHFFQVPDNPTIQFSGKPFTIMTWIEKIPATYLHGYFLSKCKQVGSTNEILFAFINNNLRFYKYTTGSAYQYYATPFNLNLNQRYHVAYTDDGSNSLNSGKIYVDGVLATNSGVNVGAFNGITNYGSPLVVGRRLSNTIPEQFEGYMDEQYIFNERELTPTEIQEVYNLGLNGQTLI